MDRRFGPKHAAEDSIEETRTMQRSIWAAGLSAVLVGCAGTPSEATKATAAKATEKPAASDALTIVYTLNVPNMT